MEKGKGKCIVCGNDEFANGTAEITITADSPEDEPFLFNGVSIHACTNCGFIQFTSKKVKP